MNDINIISFLEKLISDIKNKKIPENKLAKISELYINFDFEDKYTDTYSDKDLLKFTTLGWYIYTNQNK